MLTGKRFRLERATLGVGIRDDGKRRAVTIPVGSVIQLASGPDNGNGMVNVRWDGQAIEMFLVDLDVRGSEIRDESATA
jgi:hypothetical protein